LRLFEPTDNPTAIPFGILTAIAGAALLRWVVDRGWGGNRPVETARGIAVVAWLLPPIPILALIRWRAGASPSAPPSDHGES
jgi:hypothetical protein